MRRLTIVITVLAALAVIAAPAFGSRVVNGTVQPADLRGKPTIVMFLHPF